MVSSEFISQDLIACYLAGDKEAFATIFDALKNDIFFLVRRYFRSPFDQDEAFQEVWLHLYQTRNKFDVNRYTDFVPWTRQVVRNKCLDLVRAKKAAVEIPINDEDVGRAPEQVNSLIDARLSEALERFVEELKEEQREFFQLCFVEERSHQEIAVNMSMSERQSKYLKKKLLAKLRKNEALKKALQKSCM